jgi:hypothetical protein
MTRDSKVLATGFTMGIIIGLSLLKLVFWVLL